jgi:DNA-binding PadR family transcriptional regulator
LHKYRGSLTKIRAALPEDKKKQLDEMSATVRTIGALYPALLKLEQEGYISAEWGVSDNNRKAKFYRLTRSGRKRLEEETAIWERLAAAVARVLETA